MSDADRGFEWSPIAGWYQEIVTRMHEAHAAGSHVVNLSCTHPRGYIPNQIIRRPAIRALLREWSYDNTRAPVPLEPPRVWLPKGWPHNTDLAYCPLQPFLDEILRREHEAELEAKAKALPPTTLLHRGEVIEIATVSVPVVDLTNWHPRGGIPTTILMRLERRRSDHWRREMQAEIDRLRGLANKDDSLAATNKDRADGVTDRTKLEASVLELKARAAQYRAQARWLTEELG